MDIVDLLERALDETGRIVAGVRSDQLASPTPCGDWDVRTVIGHLVRGNQNTAAVAEGGPRQPNPIADVGDDPIGAYRESAEEVKRAWQVSGRLGATYQSPLGTLPGSALLTLRMADNLTHGWDLARATGQAPQYDDDVVEVAMTFATEQLGGNRVPGGAFAPSVAVPDGAPAIDRLAAFLGRRV